MLPTQVYVSTATKSLWNNYTDPTIGAGGTSARLSQMFAMSIDAAAAETDFYVEFGVAGTLPASVTSMQLMITQIPPFKVNLSNPF